jgi:hypothetical protein
LHADGQSDVKLIVVFEILQTRLNIWTA